LISSLLQQAKENPVFHPVDPKKIARIPLYRVGEKGRKKQVTTLVSIPEEEAPTKEEVKPEEVSHHVEIQYLLLKLGSEMGLDIWVARNDRSKICGGQTLGSMPGPRYCASRSLWSPLSCDEILTRGRNRMEPGSHAAGGGAPGWRPRPFGLVGAGSGVGVGRRGDYLRSKKKNSIEHSVPGLIRSSCDRVWQTARGGLLPLQNSRLHTQSP